MGPMTDDIVGLILAWHDAVNRQHIDEAPRLTTPDVRVGGPRGSAAGHEVLADWIRHAGIELTPTAIARGGHAHYARQLARWPGNPEARDNAPIEACTAFGVTDGRIDSVLRYETIDEATAALSDQATEEIWTADASSDANPR